MTKRIWLGIGALLLTATACTPENIQEWLAWHRQEPQEAYDWLHETFPGRLLTRSIRDGVDVHVPGPGGGFDDWTAGDCDSFADEAAAVGLPWGIFSGIAWRETRCDPWVWIEDSNDLGGALFGLNFKGNLAGYLRDLCGATPSNIRGNVELQMRCAKALYDSRGLDPWQ